MNPPTKRFIPGVSEKVDGPLVLMGVEFKCVQGHEWHESTRTVWCQIPYCPVCDTSSMVCTRQPAVAWRGIWMGF
jgi:hypothetical protein